MVAQRLTERQRDIVKFIKDFYANNHVGPTRREIMEHFGFQSTQAVTGHIKSLLKKDAITGYEKTSRGILPKSNRIKCPCCGEKFEHQL